MIIIDFEASGLQLGSFPIEVAWLGDNTPLQNHLIKPMQRWQNPELWHASAEQVHQLSMAHLLEHGENAIEVAAQLVNCLEHRLAHQNVYSDNPSFDQRWLNLLTDETGISHSIRLQNYNDLLLDITSPEVIATAQHSVQQYQPPTHRASQDVEYLYEVYRVCMAEAD